MLQLPLCNNVFLKGVPLLPKDVIMGQPMFMAIQIEDFATMI
jgi:hypothetical protein